MINDKEIYYGILTDSRITSVVDEENILDAYPATVENFPCVVYIVNGQNDLEFADNLPQAVRCSCTVHVFSKALDGYKTVTEIAMKICEVFKEHFFTCTANTEVPDPVDNIRHRTLTFTRNFLS